MTSWRPYATMLLLRRYWYSYRSNRTCRLSPLAPTRPEARYRFIKQQEPTDATATLGIESHTSARWPLPFGPELGLQHLLWWPRARLGEGCARLLGRLKGHEPGMRITLQHDRWHRGSETRVVVEQPGKPPSLLPDRQPPAPTRIGA